MKSAGILRTIFPEKRRILRFLNPGPIIKAQLGLGVIPILVLPRISVTEDLLPWKLYESLGYLPYFVKY
jgi:hypothetical protein